MKKLSLTLFGIVIFYILHAQVLFGTTSIGGNGGGTINRFEPAFGTFVSDFAFDTPDGEYGAWHTKLVQAKDGKLYGMTSNGGIYNNGIIYAYDPDAAVYTKLYDFNVSTGGQPFGSLIQAKNRKLYGMTYNGGLYGRGVIFSFDPDEFTYTKLFDFNTTDGAFPQGSLMQAKDGKLYGMTTNGGTSDYGVIFSFNIKTGVYTKLKDFNGTNGKYPVDDFIQTLDGNLYATTFNGGNNDWGIIFSYNPITSVLTKLKDFDNVNGSNPKSSFVKASDGNFYCMTWAGGSDNSGVIFSYNISTNVYTKLKDFNYADGIHPDGSLIQVANGKLFGMTPEGGSYSGGVIFSYNLATSAYNKLENFNAADGRYPYGTLVKAKDGKLYGSTSSGGKGDRGVIFSYTNNTATYSKIKDFGVNYTGSLMEGALVKDSSNILYGITHSGGDSALGVLFSFNPYTSVYTKLLDFNGDDGASPYGSLMLASDAKFYGMTSSGGTNNAGIIFSFDPVSHTYTKLKDFNYTDGGNPYGNLVQATNDTLYGITNSGGNNGSGVLFSFNPVTSAYTKILDFIGSNGAYPVGSLVQAKNGKLYGLTYNGGTNDLGVLFSFNPAKNIFKTLKNFNYTDGTGPSGALIQAANGKLYGMTAYGGNNYQGTIFSYNISTDVYTKVKDLDYINGGTPKGSLMQSQNGKLYGMTAEGGTYGNGVVFSFDPVKNIYTKIQDLDDTNGKAPAYTFFTEVSSPASTIKINNASTNEGDSGEKNMIFDVILSSPSLQTVTVDYKTINGSAKASSDYTAKNDTLKFLPGTKNKTVSLLIKGDTQPEEDEKFKVILSNPVNTIMKDSIGIGTILNDDTGFNKLSINKKSYKVDASLTATPNPATNFITATLNGFIGNINLYLKDVQGKVFRRVSLKKNNTRVMQQKFNVADLVSGIYFIVAEDGKNKQTIMFTKEL